MPTVTYAGSDLGFDLYAIEDVWLSPGAPVKVRTGIAVEGPPGCGFLLGDRSSMAARGVTYAGGRIDAGYRGEILVCLINVNQPSWHPAHRSAPGWRTYKRDDLSGKISGYICAKATRLRRCPRSMR